MYAILSALAFIGAAAAQNITASPVDIAAIKAHFTQAQLVPQLINGFDPQGTLGVTFGGSVITPGQSLQQSAVGTSPTLVISPTPLTNNISTPGTYTVVMVDADRVGTDESTQAQTRHWLVNGASLSRAAPYTISYDNATSITDYAGPGPASGSGSHRYVVLVYRQPRGFTPPANLSAAGTPLSTMFLNSYVQETGLQGPIAANYFQVEVGTASVAAAATTAVQTNTLSTSSAAASTTGSGTSSGSRTASGSATSAAATTSKAAAGRVETSYGKGLIVGAVGVIGTLVGAAIGL